MGKRLIGGSLILLCLLSTVIYNIHVYAVKIPEKLYIFADNWVENVVSLPMDTSKIEKYYSHKQRKYFIEKMSLSPTEDRIAFVVNRDSIWIVGSDGSGLTCLVCDSKPADSPEWSKDGKEIIFLSGEGGRQKWFGSETLLGITPDGKQKRIIGEFDIRKSASVPFPQWRFSPDGQYMILWQNIPRLGEERYKLTESLIHVVGVKDGNIVTTYRTKASIFNIQWFPNGKEILIEELGGRMSGDSRLVFFSISGGKRIIYPDAHQDMSPAIHPSGQFIAYLDNYILHFISKDGTKKDQILKAHDFIGHMIWTAKGDKLVFGLKNKINFFKLKRQAP